MKNKGFTLIELLLVVTLLPIVSFAVFANFNSGFKLWKALNQEVVEENLSLFYEKAAFDFENLHRYSSFPFEGDAQKVTFCTNIPAASELGGGSAIGQVSYFYDHDKGTLFRQVRDLNELYKDKPGRLSAAMTDVTDLHVSYYFKNANSDRYEWLEAWQGAADALPIAVRFDFECLRGGKKYTLTRSIALPLAEGA